MGLEKSDLNTKEKKGIEGIVQESYNQFFNKTYELFKMHDDKIEGMKEKIPNPCYGINGNGGDKYCHDFPSFYQIEGVQFLIDNKRALIADEVGVGKTAQGIAGKLELENRLGRKVKTLVICPNTVKKVWDDLSKQYITSERYSKINFLKVDDYKRDIEKIDDADFVVINYDALSFDGCLKKKNDETEKEFEERRNKNTNRKKLKQKLLDSGFEYIILDEVQNAKNYSTASRYKHIKEITDNAEYLTMLSGTSIPDSLPDTYSLISFLMPEKICLVDGKERKEGFKDAKDVAREYSKTPSIIGAILRTKRLQRRLEDIIKLPDKTKEEDEPYYINTNPEQLALYNSILDNNELDGFQKLLQLRKTLIDPKLVDREVKVNGKYVGVITDEKIRREYKNYKSSKFAALDKLVEKETKTGKVVIFSPIFRTEIIDQLKRRYEEKNHEVLVMDGTNKKERDNIIKKFQKNPNKKILIATDVAGEGISLTAADTVIFLDEPYSPGNKRQMYGRVWRPGQTKQVKIYSLINKGTIDEGVHEYLKKKTEAINILEKGLPLTPEQKMLLNNRDSIEKWLEKTLSRYFYTPAQLAVRLINNTVEKPVKAVERASKGNFGQHLAEFFTKGLEGSFPDNVSRIYGKIIESLAKKENVCKKIDIASGPGILSYALGEQGIYNLDINPHHFKTELASEKNKNIEASMTKIPLEEKFDLALCSLGLDILPNTKEEPERAVAISEANRILREGGYYIVTLPGPIVPERGKNFEIGLESAGFKIIPELTGFIESADKEIKTFTYLATAKKIKDTNREEIKNSYNYFNLHREKKFRVAQRKHGNVKDFIFADTNESLEDRIEEYLNHINYVQGDLK